MSDLDTILMDIIENDEGGWVLTASTEADPSGGWTYGGMTANSYNAAYPPLDFVAVREIITKNPGAVMTVEAFQANILQLYYTQYVEASCVDLLDEDPALQECYLSAYINSPHIAAVALQKLLLAHYSTPKGFTVDGELGPLTKQVMSEVKDANSKDWIADVDKFCQEWRLCYAELCQQETRFLPDLCGWLNRVENCRLRVIDTNY